MRTFPYQHCFKAAAGVLAMLATSQASAQSVTIDVIAPATAAPGETFVAAIRAVVSPSASIHAVAGFALDFEVQSGPKRDPKWTEAATAKIYYQLFRSGLFSDTTGNH